MKFIFYILKFSGLPFFIREVIQKRLVTILLYHDISVKNATLHFNYLKKKYNIISLQDFISAYKNKRAYELPEKSLIITLDDGHKGNYNLLPLLKSLNIPLTIFLCSNIVGTNRHYWFKHPIKGFQMHQLMQITNNQRLEILKMNGFVQDLEFENRMALSYEEIMEMTKYVDFQSHSMFHPCLPYCSSEQSENEILTSKTQLEKNFELNINSFSYPNGDYSNREIELLKKHGYDAGITCELGFNNLKTNIYKLKRLDCRDDASIIELDVKVTGVYFFLRQLLLGKKFGYKKI